jgi:hypothetical protein
MTLLQLNNYIKKAETRGANYYLTTPPAAHSSLFLEGRAQY